MIIPNEEPGDAAAIEQVTLAAFDGKSYSDQKEHLIVRKLRAAGAMSLSLVADTHGRAIAPAAFSPLAIDGESKGWYALGLIRA